MLPPETMDPKKKPGITRTQFALVLIGAGLLAEISPGLSHDFPGCGWSLLTAGSAALAAGILQKRSARLARAVLIIGFLAAGVALMRGLPESPRARKAVPAAHAP